MNSLELFGIAGDFDGEAFGGGIDHAAAEDFGFLQHGGAAFLRVRMRSSTIRGPPPAIR